METLNPDKPKSKKIDDKFNRYGFAERISQTIANRKDADCLVMGLYGAWGEGKTTVLNFIGEELAPYYPDLIMVRFNPWRFSREEDLIRGFYEELATEIGKASNAKSPKSKLKRQIEFDDETYVPGAQQINPIFNGYRNFAEVIGLGEALQILGNTISSVSIETLKDRLEQYLIEKERRLVIVFDDIDRLDRNELSAIFRLVKINADFSRTIYILSFDNEIVSQMIGKEYGEGDESGISFLEKIIQVPLRIPMAHPENIKTFSLNLISNTIDQLNIVLDDKIARRFGSMFSPYLIIRINTPRIAIRYANMLSYCLPLLDGEVNLTDLMIIEGIKLCYPNHYSLILNNPDLFLNGYSSTRQKAPGAADEVKAILAVTSAGLSGRERNAAEHLLRELFPMLNEAFENIHYDGAHVTGWLVEKRICSELHFYRYFTYSLLQTDLSDKALDDLILKNDPLNFDKGLQRFKSLTVGLAPEKIIEAIRLREDTLDWEIGIRISKYLASVSDIFSSESSMASFFTSPLNQATIFVYKIVERHKGKPDKVHEIIQIITISKTAKFAIELFRLLNDFPNNDTNDRVLSKHQKIAIFHALQSKLTSNYPNDLLFESVPNDAGYLLVAWHDLLGKKALSDYLDVIFDTNMTKISDFVYVFTPYWTSDRNPTGSFGDFTKDNYQMLTKIYSKDSIMAYIKIVYGDDILNAEAEFHHRLKPNTKDNAVKQFVKYYEEDVNAHI